jgi:lipopolysaccharide/colanic/teichoic acid biosynthesis glycosyltransferase
MSFGAFGFTRRGPIKEKRCILNEETEFRERKPEQQVTETLMRFIHKNRPLRERGPGPLSETTLRDDRTGLYHAEYFAELLALEKKRCARSEESILMMLVDLKALGDTSERCEVARLVAQGLSRVTRETDAKGWYVNGSVAAIMFIESAKGKNPDVIIRKCYNGLRESLDPEQFSRVRVSWSAFPDDFPKLTTGAGSVQKGESGAPGTKERGRLASFVKRLVDVVGSVVVMVLLSPVFLAIAILIKIDSAGPVLFRQERIGLGGKKFMFLKFRSMHVNNDPAIHREYVGALINGGRAHENPGTDGGGVYKIKHDPRVTRAGKILRRTSLDELPQMINVLKGDMSLVGPRPPIPYEYRDYRLWHRRRVMDMKPGITGLWQVNGRSAVSFDEAVRMDIRYIREWSLWLDIKIILRTPAAMVTCRGAY